MLNGQVYFFVLNFEGRSSSSVILSIFQIVVICKTVIVLVASNTKKLK